jgi:hypothetical protein
LTWALATPGSHTIEVKAVNVFDREGAASSAVVQRA